MRNHKPASQCFDRFAWLSLSLALGSTTVHAYSDPTRPPNAEAPAAISTTESVSSFNLTAVFISPNQRLAIINDQAIKLGDKIGQYTVTTIDTNAVELTGPQDSHETLFLSPTVKSRSGK